MSHLGRSFRLRDSPTGNALAVVAIALAATATAFASIADGACPSECLDESYLETTGGTCIASCLPNECGGGGDFCGDLTERVRSTRYSDSNCVSVITNDGPADLFYPKGCNENTQEYDYNDEVSFDFNSNLITCIDDEPVRVFYSNSDCSGESTTLPLDPRHRAKSGECIVQPGYGTSLKYTCPSTNNTSAYSGGGQRCTGTRDCEGDYMCAEESGCDVGVCVEARMVRSAGTLCNTIASRQMECPVGLKCEAEQTSSASPGEGYCRFPFEDYYDVTMCDPSIESSAAGAVTPVVVGTAAAAFAATLGVLTTFII